MGLAGLAITDKGTIYAKLNGGENYGIYELDRANQPKPGSLSPPAVAEVADNERDERGEGSRSASPHG
jgi:hypothetical protein